MKAKKSKGKTNWDLLRTRRKSAVSVSTKQQDETHVFWSDTDVVIPGGKSRMTVRFDTDVVEWFKSQGPRYQTRMNMALRQFMRRQNASEHLSKEAGQYVSEPIDLSLVSKMPPGTSAAEYLRALNWLGEISMHRGNVEEASKYFELVVSCHRKQNQR